MSSTTEAGSGAGVHATFTRTASGLIREMSLADAALFGIFATGGLYAWLYVYPYGQGLSPGFSTSWYILLALAFGVLVYVTYAGVGSAMPRAGGDYLYETRTLHRVVGFLVPWTCQIVFWLMFPITGAYVVNTLGLSPLLSAIGLDGAASWCLTETGTFVITFVVILACWGLNVAGLRFYRRLQKWVMIPLLAIGTATIIVVLISGFGGDFASSFAAFHDDLTVSAVKSAAVEAGYEKVGFSFGNTLLWVGILAGFIPYSMFSAQGLLGEVKEASNFRRLFLAFLIPGAIVGLIMLLLPWLLLEGIAGKEFLNEFAVAYMNGTVSIDYFPNINTFVQMLNPNPAVAILVSLGFISGGFGIANVVFMTASRVMMAMSLDGLLPRWLSDVSKRFYAPVKSLSVWSLVAVGVAAWFSYQPDFALSILAAGAITSVAVVGVTCLGAGLFPYTAPDIYKSSPIAKYRLGKVHLITVIGLLAFAFDAVMVYLALTVPELGLTDPQIRIALGVAFGIGVVFYIGYGIYRRSRGIDVSLTTREVPPE